MFYSARVIDTNGVGIRSVDWCAPLYGKILSGVWGLSTHIPISGLGCWILCCWYLPECLLQPHQQSWSQALLTPTYAYIPTETLIMLNCFKWLHKKPRDHFVFFTFVFTGHFLYLRADSTQTSGMAKACSTSLPASLATEDYQVSHSVLAPLWSKSPGCRHYLHN